MAETVVKHGTGIEWTHGSGYKGETWNPVVGCSKVSAGCRHCYAETVHRQKFDGKRGYPEFRPWSKLNAEHNVTLMPHRLDQPLRWGKPRMVFVNSMSDLFHELLTPKFIAEVFAVMAVADRHVFQVLTKRPERMANLTNDPRFWQLVHDAICDRQDWVPGFLPGDGRVALSNVWLGTSIENRKWIERADALRDTPAAVRFISAEPLLGPLVPCTACTGTGYETTDPEDASTCLSCTGTGGGQLDITGIDWLIVGGESGAGHRPMRIEWVRELRDAAAESGTAFFLKQLGGNRPGGALEDLPEDLRIREMPADKRVILSAT